MVGIYWLKFTGEHIVQGAEFFQDIKRVDNVSQMLGDRFFDSNENIQVYRNHLAHISPYFALAPHSITTVPRLAFT